MHTLTIANVNVPMIVPTKPVVWVAFMVGLCEMQMGEVTSLRQRMIRSEDKK